MLPTMMKVLEIFSVARHDLYLCSHMASAEPKKNQKQLDPPLPFRSTGLLQHLMKHPTEVGNQSWAPHRAAHPASPHVQQPWLVAALLRSCWCPSLRRRGGLAAWHRSMAATSCGTPFSRRGHAPCAMLWVGGDVIQQKHWVVQNQSGTMEPWATVATNFSRATVNSHAWGLVQVTFFVNTVARLSKRGQSGGFVEEKAMLFYGEFGGMSATSNSEFAEFLLQHSLPTIPMIPKFVRFDRENQL